MSATGDSIRSAGSVRPLEVTGVPMTINGTDSVPVGLFGVHATALDAQRIAAWGITSERRISREPSGVPVLPGKGAPEGLSHLIECMYDRYQPALVLTDPDWERHLRDLALRYAAGARGTGWQHHVEFWNEPYLNWSCKPGVNYDARHFDQEFAVVDGPVTITGQSQPTELLRWKRGLRASDAVTGEINYVFASYAPRHLKAGDTYPVRGTTYRLDEAWVAYDPSQRHYWAGQQNVLWYNRMYRVFASALKQANPEVQVAAGWGFNMWNEDWEAWHRLYVPLLDSALPLMDAVHEHHYGGDTRLVAASYEVATAYTDERGRRLRFWNTEAGGLLDPQQPTTVGTSTITGEPLPKAIGAMTYMLRDIVHLLAVCPDKAQARAAHEAQLNGGDEFAFKLLKPLRGTLIEVRNGDDQRWCVASRDGSTLAVICFNDAASEDGFDLVVRAPAGCALTSGTMLTARPRGDRQGLELHEEPVAVTDGAAWRGRLPLPAKSARTLVFTLAGAPAPTRGVRITQHFAHGILATVGSGGQLIRRIVLPAGELAQATRARLKIVVSGQDRDAAVLVNGKRHVLAPGTWTIRQDLPVAQLAEHTELVFTAGAQPYQLLMASLELLAD